MAASHVDSPSLFADTQAASRAPHARRPKAAPQAAASIDDPGASLTAYMSTVGPDLVRSVEAVRAEWNELPGRPKAKLSPPPIRILKKQRVR